MVIVIYLQSKDFVFILRSTRGKPIILESTLSPVSDDVKDVLTSSTLRK